MNVIILLLAIMQISKFNISDRGFFLRFIVVITNKSSYFIKVTEGPFRFVTAKKRKMLLENNKQYSQLDVRNREEKPL
jgi:hypothetical protein